MRGGGSDLLQEALQAASDTKVLHMKRGALAEIGRVFTREFGAGPAVVIADPRTFEVAGRRVIEELQSAGVETGEPVLLTDSDLHAEWKHIEFLDAALKQQPGTPIAVGAGTINDLTKLAAHRAGRQYMAVPTAASMDGYTAFGASITKDGSKQTFSCPAPRVVVADLDVVCAAPAAMTASGYADLMAKVTAGADWLVADALGIEPVDAFSWKLVQEPLQGWLAEPRQIQDGEPEAIGRLMEGLMMGGFAMQHLQSSRPASGAEHQFSHLWDMQHHTHEGVAPSHGFKVGIGTLAVARLYEALIRLPLDQLDVDAAVAKYPSWDQMNTAISAELGTGELGTKALEESRAKHLPGEDLRKLLVRLKGEWPQLRERLRAHLPSHTQISLSLAAVGAPVLPKHIGIEIPRLQASYRQALYIRRRFTVLDLAFIAGVLAETVAGIYSRPALAR